VGGVALRVGQNDQARPRSDTRSSPSRHALQVVCNLPPLWVHTVPGWRSPCPPCSITMAIPDHHPHIPCGSAVFWEVWDTPPPPHTHTHTITVLYCTVLYCTVLYCISCSHFCDGHHSVDTYLRLLCAQSECIFDVLLLLLVLLLLPVHRPMKEGDGCH
jgi:hypothetical protein